CRDISARTAQRYMKLSESPEVRTAMGKNDTVSPLSLRAALALANRKPKPDPQPSNEYDRAENKLVEKLEALSPDTAEAAASVTVERCVKLLLGSRRLRSRQRGRSGFLVCPLNPRARTPAKPISPTRRSCPAQ